MKLLFTTPTLLALFSGMMLTTTVEVQVVHADAGVCKAAPGNECEDYYMVGLSYINVNNTNYCRETRDDSVCDGSFCDVACGGYDDEGKAIPGSWDENGMVNTLDGKRENGTAVSNITEVCGVAPTEIPICTPSPPADKVVRPKLCVALPKTTCSDYDISFRTTINVNDTDYCREPESVCDGSWGGPIYPDVDPDGNITDVCGFPPEELTTCTEFDSATTIGISLVTVMMMMMMMVGGMINVLL